MKDKYLCLDRARLGGLDCRQVSMKACNTF
jgi:hypothetical protein